MQSAQELEQGQDKINRNNTGHIDHIDNKVTNMTLSPITLTDEAVKAIKDKMAARADAVGLRLEIKSTGCSGHSYQMAYAMEEPGEADDRIEKDGAVLLVPKIHSWMLFGMEIGYEETQLKSGFTFTNPNESGRCGCGESFTVERPPA